MTGDDRGEASGIRIEFGAIQVVSAFQQVQQQVREFVAALHDEIRTMASYPGKSNGGIDLVAYVCREYERAGGTN